MMLEELQRRNYSKTTVNAYLKMVASFANHFRRSPDQLGPEEIRAYQVYLFTERKLGARTVGHHTAALRFFLLQDPEAKLPTRRSASGPKRVRELYGNARAVVS
jgi:site-specific recombinase XerD